MATKKTVEEMVEDARAQGVHYVQFQFPDVNGALRCMEENIDLLPKFSRTGVGVDGSSIAGFAEVNKSDVRLFPDMDTFQIYKFGESKVCRVLCKVFWQGKPHPGCTRGLFEAVLAKAKNMGFEVSMFGELEWYFLNVDGTPHDHAGYCSLPPDDKALEIRHELGELLTQAGCLVKRIHHECGHGQNEVELKLAPARKNADDLITSAAIIRMLAAQHNLKATFEPKPIRDDAGSGFHQHFALYDVNTKKNMFAGAEVGEISELGKHFIAGMIAHASEITSVFGRCEETFIRLLPGHEAPCSACWGTSNRTALIRIPDISDSQDTRIEYRGGDASGSTHLMCAIILAAGLDGIEKKMECPKETTDNVDILSAEEIKSRGIVRLPATPAAALQVLKGSEWAHSVLGDHIYKFLVATHPAAPKTPHH